MKEIPIDVLKSAWVAGVKARRATTKRSNDHMDPGHLWDSEPDAEAGMRAAAEVILGWAGKERGNGSKNPRKADPV